MLRRGAVHAIKALLEMARDPSHWRSVSDLAAVQGLPAPMLEQLLLRLRRAGLLEARRGRTGGYRLSRPAGDIAVADILDAVEGKGLRPPPGGDGVLDSAATEGSLGAGWTTMGHGGGEAAESPAGAQEDAVGLEIDASDRVTSALRNRLRRAVERELTQLTLEELLYDLRSTRAAISEEGGLLLG
jgi:DNA-binding IscR family transcriptional regulator